MLTTPTADLMLVYSTDSSGQLTVDLVHAPSGDLRLAVGGARLQQDILRWLLTPLGSNPFDPSFGNPLWALIGRPTSDGDVFLDMLNQAEADFLQRQSEDAAQGWLSLDEQVDHFSDATVTFQQPGVVLLSFNIYTKAGTSLSAAAPFTVGVTV